MKKYASLYIIFILFVICAVLVPPSSVAHGATRNTTATVEYSAKEYYNLLYVQHIRAPDTAMLEFAERENNIMVGIIKRRGFCTPNSTGLKLVYYLYHVGLKFIEDEEETPFIATRQYETFTAHEVIEVGLYYSQVFDCV